MTAVISVVVALIIAIPVTIAVTSSYQKNAAAKTIGTAEDKAREIIA